MTELAKQSWLQDRRLHKLFGVIEQAGGTAKVAGGAVRNGLWGLPVTDIDIATTLMPQAMVDAAKAGGLAVYPTGFEHGTVTIVFEGLSLEVTTLRADVETDGRHAVVAFSDDWAVDAARRDFTFNALYCDLAGEVYDETGQGMDDHQTRRVRFVGEAEQRIEEDYLRILRYFRFEAQYGAGDFDEQALAACVKLQEGLKGLSVERVQSELFKILVAPRARLVVAKMAGSGVLGQVIEVDGSIAKFERLVDLQSHLAINDDAVSRLALLTTKADHLRLSKAQLRRFEGLHKSYALTPSASDHSTRKMLFEIGGMALRDAVMMAWARGDAAIDDLEWCSLYELPDHWAEPVFPLAGKDLIAAGFKPGKEMGKTLKALEKCWIDQGFEASKKELIKWAQTGNI